MRVVPLPVPTKSSDDELRRSGVTGSPTARGVARAAPPAMASSIRRRWHLRRRASDASARASSNAAAGANRGCARCSLRPCHTCPPAGWALLGMRTVAWHQGGTRRRGGRSAPQRHREARQEVQPRSAQRPAAATVSRERSGVRGSGRRSLAGGCEGTRRT